MAFLLPCIAAADATLPVHLADNHAESFGWIARTVDLDAPHTLVHLDAHTDASAAERSEEIREQVRRVASLEERAARVEAWRTTGRLQAFNWIEPLLPRPLDRVIWIPRPELNAFEARIRTREAIAQLDGRLEVEPRGAGSFASRWETRDLAGLAAWNAETTPTIVSLDLDFFAGMEAAEREAAFATIWTTAMDWAGLRGVTCSVSRPWMRDDAEAEALVRLVVDAVARTPQARLEIDASLDNRADTSLKAAEFGEGPVPRWDLVAAPASTRAALLALGRRLALRDRARDWDAILGEWRDATPLASIRPESGEIDLDGVWRFPQGQEPVLRLHPPPGATGRVRWFRLDPARAAYDLVPETGLGKDFADSPARWITETASPLAETWDFLLAPGTWRSESPGRVRLAAECETPEGWIPAPPVELRLGQGEGFRAALSECFGMPYVFGIAFCAEDGLSGVETGWGADCSNLLIHAWRRQGIPLDWGDPGILRRQLATKAEGVRLGDRIEISPGEIERGLAVDFGRHVAAVWEDREPLGLLDGGDLLVHHLGGLPEIATLAELAETRPEFSLHVPKPSSGVRLALAGDVVLSGDERVAIPDFERGEADLFLANLEGIPSLRGPETKPRYDFRFPPERIAFLQEHRLDAVSLANNHALDAGPEGLVEGIAALKDAGIGVFGAGRNEVEAVQPWRADVGKTRIAVFGVSLLPGGAAGADAAGVARLPDHRGLLATALREARGEGERIVVFVHGGDEYSDRVNDEQRRWARWLISQGAEVIAGAHPHVVQRAERHGGATVLHSLGNAVYPRELKGADSGEVRVVELP